MPVLSASQSLSRSPARRSVSLTLSSACQPPLSLLLANRRSLSRSLAAALSPASALCSLPLSGLSPSLCSLLSLSAICRSSRF
ncbi:hypothetical protein FH972_002351 [Carpinus fangiana]|uniref:Uncharacterized protein n=1 Tax=Carpinus fangiana TaxID=176857 RepID=A0A5N6QEY8_9ROSI|nr:hypothetical protein FH972_002351 [Carpinus fangiana]